MATARKTAELAPDSDVTVAPSDAPSSYNNTCVIKKNGTEEPATLSKITARIENLCDGLDLHHVDVNRLSKSVLASLRNGVRTSVIDNLAAELAATMMNNHPDYGVLATRLAVTSLHNKTLGTFSSYVRYMYSMTILSDELFETVMVASEQLDAAINHSRDFDYTYFGFKTLKESYLHRVNGRTVERPQYMLMCVALGIHGDKIPLVLETYDYMSRRYFVHGLPTLFSAGTRHPRIDSFYRSSGDGFILVRDRESTSSGSVGDFTHVHRVKDRSSSGKLGDASANGFVPTTQVFNDVSLYAAQQFKKRSGVVEVYLEPWNENIFEYLATRKFADADETRTRVLPIGLWVPDLFMRRVEEDAPWSLMCPTHCPILSNVWGAEFEALYVLYETKGFYVKRVPARKLMTAIAECQMENGVPHMLYMGKANRRSNSAYSVTSRASNQYKNTIVENECAHASIAVNMFVADDGTYDFTQLLRVAEVVTKNLNKVIDRTWYVNKGFMEWNRHYRPIGIGIQGLADAFIRMRLPFESEEACQLNIDIMETLHYATMKASCELAKKRGPYGGWMESPASFGRLACDMWEWKPNSGLWNWTRLRQLIAEHGLRNSSLTSLMQTSTMSQILENNDSFEPFISNLTTRRTMAGKFQATNTHLIVDLLRLGLWDKRMRKDLISCNGSVQSIARIPVDLKALYKTVWEIPQAALIDMAVDRLPYVDLSHSLNIYMEEPTVERVVNLHLRCWKCGLKTGMYRLRTKPAAIPDKFSF